MADKFISTSGNDTTGDGSESTPWRSIQKAVDTVASGDTIHIKDDAFTEPAGYVQLDAANAGETYTLTNYNGNSPAVTFSHVSLGFYMTADWDSGRLIIDDVDVMSSGATVSSGLVRCHGDSAIELYDMNLGDDSALQSGVYFSDDTGQTSRELIMRNCTVNTVLRPVRVLYDAKLVCIEDCGIYATAVDAQVAVALGVDGSVNANPLGKVIFRGNTVVHDGAVRSHALLLGSGCDCATVEHNYCAGGDIQCVVKGNGNALSNNIFYGPQALYIKGGEEVSVIQNTIYGTVGGGNYALRLQDEGGGDVPDGSFISGNIIVADGENVYAFCNDQDDHHDCYIDYNCYWVKNSAKLAKLVGADYLTLSALRAKWEDYDFAFRYINEQNSILEDPRFIDVSNKDFRPGNSKMLCSNRNNYSGIPTKFGAIAPALNLNPQNGHIINTTGAF